jgi:hypothetical protein
MRALSGLFVALASLLMASGGLARASAPTPGTITTSADDGRDSPVDGIFDDAVQRALLNANFQVLPGTDHGRYIARFSVMHRGLGVVTSRAKPQSAEVAGAGLNVGLPSHKSELSGLSEIRLDVRIFRRDTAQMVWHGSAITTGIEATGTDQPAFVARKLAEALLRQFPRSSDTPIAVP